jgi:hypothetical protein
MLMGSSAPAAAVLMTSFATRSASADWDLRLGGECAAKRAVENIELVGRE